MNNYSSTIASSELIVTSHIMAAKWHDYLFIWGGGWLDIAHSFSKLVGLQDWYGFASRTPMLILLSLLE